MKTVAYMVLFIAVVPALASADLVIKEKTSTSGLMGMGASEAAEVTYIKGDRLRTETESAYLGMAPGMVPEKASKMVTIMRLDKGVVWHLDEKRGTYTEISLKAEGAGGTVEDMHFKVKDVKVTKSGEKKEIAGYKCAGIDVVMAFEVTSEEGMVLEPAQIRFWMAPKTKELEEMRNLWEGMVESVRGGRGGLPMRSAMEELAKTLEDLEGVPLGMDMVLTIGMGGPPGEEEEMQEAMKMMRQFMKGGEAEEEDEEGEGPPPNQIRIMREAVSISEEEVDGSLFEIPEGYKKATQPRTR